MSDFEVKYWQGFEQLTNDREYIKRADNEFAEELPLEEDKNSGSSRRDFLKMMGFGIAAASLAACEAPIRKAVPYVKLPEDVTPGIPNYYASSYMMGGEYSSVVVKTREGRPIKLEGNPLSPVTKGAISGQVEASVLTLYDKERLRGPRKNGEDISWEQLDKEVINGLAASAAAGKTTTIVSYSLPSPSTIKVVEQLNSKYGNIEHIAYEPVSLDAIRNAHQDAFGVRAIPSFHFDKAEVIVSFSADFLGTWISPDRFSRDYATGRKLAGNNPKMNRHYQFEANMSLTGANADYRTFMKPGMEGMAVAALYNEVASAMGVGTISAGKKEFPMLKKAARDLIQAKGKALVVSASTDKNVQLLVIALNNLLGNYGTTLDLSNPLLFKEADSAKLSSFISKMNAGEVGSVIFYNCNPVYDYYKGADIARGLEKVSTTISFNDRNDETGALATYQAPDHHYLESWNDFEPVKGHLSLSQPAITPLFNTRQAQQSLLMWAGSMVSYEDFLKEQWKAYFDQQNDILDFQLFWDTALAKGVFSYSVEPNSVSEYSFDISQVAGEINSRYKESDGNELVLYTKVAIGTGYQANNPWLQEMPDPITKATWENYLTVSISQANEWNLVMNEAKTKLAKVSIGGKEIELPVFVQPGQAPGTMGLALGYGRTKAGKVGDNAGFNAYPLVGEKDGVPQYYVQDVQVEITDKPYQLAQTQTSLTYMGRATVVQESTFSEYKKDPSAGRFNPKIITKEGPVEPNDISLWDGHEYPNHHWGMVIDLNSCTGCGNCTIACQVENNVPVVGKEEVYRRRDMHWIRIDRYFSSKGNAEDKSISGLRMLEKAAENPDVIFQPVMCQQCNNAPCETVCPVAATTHSTEGLNQMTYNRCIGTRYCANNCPYKVRRFNWFKYHDNDQFADVNTPANDDLGKMVLNPDVTVRSRGVMEKCTFCVQRIQSGKLQAKKEKRKLEDSDVNSACAAACPTEAIVFGDMNNPESRISKVLKMEYKEGKKRMTEPRSFHMLEEIRVAPNVVYFTKIKNKDKEDTQA